MRRSPAATTFSKSLGEVGDLLDSSDMFKTGSSSDDGDLGEWKVELFFSGRLDSAEMDPGQAWWIDVGWQEAKVGVPLVL